MYKIRFISALVIMAVVLTSGFSAFAGEFLYSDFSLNNPNWGLSLGELKAIDGSALATGVKRVISPYPLVSGYSSNGYPGPYIEATKAVNGNFNIVETGGYTIGEQVYTNEWAFESSFESDSLVTSAIENRLRFVMLRSLFGNVGTEQKANSSASAYSSKKMRIGFRVYIEPAKEDGAYQQLNVSLVENDWNTQQISGFYANGGSRHYYSKNEANASKNNLLNERDTSTTIGAGWHQIEYYFYLPEQTTVDTVNYWVYRYDLMVDNIKIKDKAMITIPNTVIGTEPESIIALQLSFYTDKVKTKTSWKIADFKAFIEDDTHLQTSILKDGKILKFNGSRDEGELGIAKTIEGNLTFRSVVSDFGNVINSENPANYIIAMYDDAGNLLKIAMKQIDILPASKNRAYISLDATVPETATYAKTFLWIKDSLNPLTGSVQFK